ncbi:MAG: hypothetical protein CVU18_00745, partial [Betaproteobacteria bacterium HGW-Betaproteobacteria-12]
APGATTPVAATPATAGERQRPDERSGAWQSRQRDAEPAVKPAVAIPPPVVLPPPKAPPVAAAPHSSPPPAARPPRGESRPIPVVARQQSFPERQPAALPPAPAAPVNATPVAAQRSSAGERQRPGEPQGERRDERNGDSKRDERDERRR